MTSSTLKGHGSTEDGQNGATVREPQRGVFPAPSGPSWRAYAMAATALLAGCLATYLCSDREVPQAGLLGSLAFLPFVIVVFTLARGSATFGGQSSSQPTRDGLPEDHPCSIRARTQPLWDLYLLGPLLIAIGLLHSRLGIPGSERMVAALLYLFGGLVVFRSLPSLVRSLGKRRRVGWQFLVLPLSLFAMLAPWTTSQRAPDGDEPWYLLITHSLAYDLDDDLANNYVEQDSLRFMDRALEPQQGDPPAENGELRSRHGMLLPLLLSPAYLALGYPGAIAMMILLSATLCWFTVTVIYHSWESPEHTSVRGHNGATVLAWALMALTAPLLLFSYQIWVEVPAGLLLIIGYRQFQKLSQNGPSARPIILLLATFVVLPALKLRFGLFAASLAALVGLQSRLPRRQVGFLGATSGLALLGVLAYNQIIFGNALRIHAWQELLKLPSLNKFLGLFYDNAFGLFVAAPIWMVVIPGAIYLWRRNRKLAFHLGLLMTPSILLVTTRVEWYAGWSPPFRYLVAVLPFFAILAAYAFASRRGTGARILLPPLLMLSAGAGALWTAVPGWTYNFANGTSYWIDQWSRLSGVDWMRIVPSAVRPSTTSVIVPTLLALTLAGLWFGLKTSLSPSSAKALGLALGLLSVALPTALAQRLTTTHLEAESAIVSKTGGHPEPRRWTNNRTRFREGWTLRHGEQLIFPVLAGGSKLSIQIAHRLFRNRSEDLDLEIYADDRKVGEVRMHNPDEWLIETIGPFDWNNATSLRLQVGMPLGEGQPGVVNGVAIDFLDFSWN